MLFVSIHKQLLVIMIPSAYIGVFSGRGISNTSRGNGIKTSKHDISMLLLIVTMVNLP